MEESSVISLVDMETVEPKHKLNRSPGSIYVLLLALLLGAISLVNLLESRWQVPRYLAQPALYAAIAATGYLIYRRNYISYRYTLTDRMFAIERITGNRERLVIAVPLEEIRGIRALNRAAHSGSRQVNASIPPIRKSTLIELDDRGKRLFYRISPSENFLQNLTAQWQSVMAQKE